MHLVALHFIKFVTRLSKFDLQIGVIEAYLGGSLSVVGYFQLYGKHKETH